MPLSQCQPSEQPERCSTTGKSAGTAPLRTRPDHAAAKRAVPAIGDLLSEVLGCEPTILSDRRRLVRPLLKCRESGFAPCGLLARETQRVISLSQNCRLLSVRYECRMIRLTPEVLVPAFAAWPRRARPTVPAGHAGATAKLNLTFYLDHSAGADHTLINLRQLFANRERKVDRLAREN
jgi:hypothetical protein